ncbi:jmjC domain-containing protein 4-like isoform X2 [Acanthaster planci]|uniref:2-oxoglutarate and iron-dependent oxygenase JMJD4 n=1 Tax=Acanthaster planci TaxID=133434 RepID=A0A8B7XHC0_ACAPL|nr:jmjC domain-containing protein 4-like isoform X2 [Acanthaster planci]
MTLRVLFWHLLSQLDICLLGFYKHAFRLIVTMASISRDALKAVLHHDSAKLRCDFEVGEVEYISAGIYYDEFFSRFLIPNKPCVFGPHITREWRAVQEWVMEDGRPNFDFLAQNFGDAVVPVADCKMVEYSAQPKSDMQLAEYLHYWEQLNEDVRENTSCLYLKDWHFKKSFPDYKAYRTPVFFTSDWMNEYWDKRPGQTSDDYRFVYMGPKGSWTPFHADVFRSYSWSANVCGRKRWLLYPPGQEDCLRDVLGNLVYDATSPELHNPNKYPDYHKACKPFEVIQEPGEVIFVPSGWHHQVFNIEDTISINHNWLNGCNLDITWAFLQQELALVKKSISDCRDMEGWDLQCQMIMKANTGIDYPEFLQLLWTVAEPRLDQLRLYSESSRKCSNSRHSKPDKPLDRSKRSQELHGLNTRLSSGNPERTVESTVSGEILKPSSVEDSRGTVELEGQSSHCARGAGRILSNTDETATPSDMDRATNDHTGSADPNQPSSPCSEECTCICDSDTTSRWSTVWHMIFDLCRIGMILESLRENEDFCRLETGSLCVDPQQVIGEIICVTEGLV